MDTVFPKIHILLLRNVAELFIFSIEKYIGIVFTTVFTLKNSKLLFILLIFLIQKSLIR